MPKDPPKDQPMDNPPLAPVYYPKTGGIRVDTEVPPARPKEITEAIDAARAVIHSNVSRGEMVGALVAYMQARRLHLSRTFGADIGFALDDECLILGAGE